MYLNSDAYPRSLLYFSVSAMYPRKIFPSCLSPGIFKTGGSSTAAISLLNNNVEYLYDSNCPGIPSFLTDGEKTERCFFKYSTSIGLGQYTCNGLVIELGECHADIATVVATVLASSLSVNK